MSSPEILLEAQSLEVRYGGTQAVRGIDLQVERGEVLGMIGPDGAGKTSTIRCLCALQRATSGEVQAFGRDAWKKRRQLHQRVGYLAQGFALYGDLTVNENVRFFAMLNGVRGWKARRAELLERVGLAPFGNREAQRLSGGMKQKLALACTLIHDPEILLLDEPTTGVDPVTRRELWRLLAELVADGLTLLVATPYLDEAERCSRVLLLHRGELLADSEPHELPAVVPGRMIRVRAEPRAEAMQWLRGLPGVADVTVFGAALHVRLEAGRGGAEALEQSLRSGGLRVHELSEVSTGLEDAFLYLTRHHERQAEAS